MLVGPNLSHIKVNSMWGTFDQIKRGGGGGRGFATKMKAAESFLELMLML